MYNTYSFIHLECLHQRTTMFWASHYPALPKLYTTILGNCLFYFVSPSKLSQNSPLPDNKAF